MENSEGLADTLSIKAERYIFTYLFIYFYCCSHWIQHHPGCKQVHSENPKASGKLFQKVHGVRHLMAWAYLFF